jgi:Tfp pilus assembly protein PilZ
MVTKEQAAAVASNIMLHLERMGDAPAAERNQLIGSIVFETLANTPIAQQMKKGTKVSWLADGASVRGHGVTISDEENGRILVAVDGGVLENIPAAYHMVIYCTVTWLTAVA